MALIDILFRKDGCPFASCELGIFNLGVGEQVQISLDAKNPLWPEYVIGTVTIVDKDATGFNYTIQFEGDDLNGGPQFEGCDIQVEPWCCCDKLDVRVTALEEEVGDIHVLEGQTVVPDENGVAIIEVVGNNNIPLDPVTLDLNSLLDNTDDHVLAGQTLTPDVNGVVIMEVIDKDGNPLEPITFNLGVFFDNTFSLLTPNTDGTASFTNADGTDGPRVILPPPIGTPLNYVPKPNGIGGVIWVADELDNSCCEDTTYQFIRSGENLVITSSGDCDPVTLVDIFTIGDGTTYTYIQSGLDLVITPSNGDPATTLVNIFATGSGDTGTSYSFVQTGEDLVITPTDGSTPTTLIGAFTTPVTYTHVRVGDDLVVTPSNGDPAVGLVDVFAQGDCAVDVVEITADTTLDVTHQNKLVRVNSSADVVITLPAGDPLMTTAFVCSVTKVGTGQVTFAGAAGVIIESNGLRIFNRYQGIAVHFISNDRFQMYGDLY